MEKETLNKIEELDPAWGKDAVSKRFSECEGLLKVKEENGKRFEGPPSCSTEEVPQLPDHTGCNSFACVHLPT